MLASAFEVDLPDWLTAVDSQYLAGGMETVDIEESLDVEDFGSERLQEALEAEIGNNIPMKSSALLVNASLQRSCIELSNGLFCWDCYPTYFGSERLYDLESDALYRFPYDNTFSRVEKFDEFVDCVDAIAAVYPDKQFCVYLVDASQYDASNPARSLFHCNLLDVNDCAERANGISNSGNLTFVGDAVPASKDYHEFFYSTDHHWNGYGTKRAYESISQAMSLDVRASPIKGESTFQGLRINGSDARAGLMLLDEPVREPLFRFSNTKITQGDLAPVFISGVGFAESIPFEAEFDFYHSWFGKGSLSLENSEREGSILLIGDSYTYSLRWLLGNACNRLVQRADFASGHPAELKQRGRTMRDLISSTSPDKVILVASPSDFISMNDVFEDYFM